ncbi:uncharacterized protein LOC120255762 isoform X6 [Dioscorea cayenensis subsp. rotundata]|uniref:Uncharacterized protein LOC120255762 isoform X6 n=1 Tax=Dioscorea cayennensis subsp. rotundata TaxID=55577 RepID=A0AB40AYQ3_DIOCR|nr:uncharacterized protein LOC120255762 isoform X6 [Dioscorea cayenensis subsp. rotundata]
MDFVGKLCIGAVCSCIQSPVVSEGMGHIFCTKEKLDSLDSPMEALMARKRDFETQLDIPCSSRQRPTYQLQFWLEKVSEKDEEVKQLKDKFGKQECTFGTCYLNCYSRGTTSYTSPCFIKSSGKRNWFKS